MDDTEYTALIELNDLLKEFHEPYRHYYAEPGYFARKLGKWLCEHGQLLGDAELFEMTRKINKSIGANNDFNQTGKGDN